MYDDVKLNLHNDCKRIQNIAMATSIGIPLIGQFIITEQSQQFFGLHFSYLSLS